MGPRFSCSLAIHAQFKAAGFVREFKGTSKITIERIWSSDAHDRDFEKENEMTRERDKQ